MKDLINLFRQFKLGNSLFKCRHKFTIEENSYLNADAQDSIVRKQVTDSFSTYVVEKHQSSIVREISDDGAIEYSIELLVVKREDFKSIVEATIQMLTEDQITKIKNGEIL